MRWNAVLILIFALAGCTTLPIEKEAYVKIEPVPEHLRGKAMIAAADARAVDAGLSIMQKGGSATDAAIAAEMVLGLVEPQSSGIGGGGFLLAYNPSPQRFSFYDGRETAPAATTSELFLDASGKPLSFTDAAHSGLSVGAPGLVAMLWMAHLEQGVLPWADLFQPAITLAEQGFVVSPRLSSLLAWSKSGRIDDVEPSRSMFYDASGQPRPAGYVIKNPAYGRTLRAIAELGPRALQDGDIARRIVDAVQKDPRPGTLSLADLDNYKPVKRQPLCAVYRQHEVCSSPPPGGGGAVLSALGVLQEQPAIAAGPTNTDSLGLFIDASRLAYADRDYYFADPDKVPVPISALVAPAYLSKRSMLIAPGKKLDSAAPGDPLPHGKSLMGHWAGDKTSEVAGTTHLSVVDARGNVVALTATVEAAFGAQLMVDGFFLNNQLTDFAMKPSPDGRPFANAPGPTKRPRSSMSPTIILDPKGHFYAATGSPGGSSIIAYTLKSVVGLIDWSLTPQEAAALPNIVARQGSVRMELSGAPPSAVDALRARGYRMIDSTGEASGLHIIKAGIDGYEGGADPRREGVAKGF